MHKKSPAYLQGFIRVNHQLEHTNYNFIISEKCKALIQLFPSHLIQISVDQKPGNSSYYKVDHRGTIFQEYDLPNSKETEDHEYTA